jgi:hypothetical protein
LLKTKKKLFSDFSAASASIMLPVALAIADECTQCSDRLLQGNGKLDERIK